jgi:hypothetical protein
LLAAAKLGEIANEPKDSWCSPVEKQKKLGVND